MSKMTMKMTMIGEIVCGLATMDTKYVRLAHEIITKGLKGNDGKEMRKQLLQALRNPQAIKTEYVHLAPREIIVLNPPKEAVNLDFFSRRGRASSRELFGMNSAFQIDDNFINRILAVARPDCHMGELTFRTFSLLNDPTDVEIRSELSRDHVFNATQACYVIPRMITQQDGGGLEHLKIDRNLNHLYVHGLGGEVFRVTVGYISSEVTWWITCNSLDNRLLCTGSQALSLN